MKGGEEYDHAGRQELVVRTGAAKMKEPDQCGGGEERDHAGRQELVS
jgi:hypothetical protein